MNTNNTNEDKDAKKYLSAKEQAELLKKALTSIDDDMDIFKNLTHNSDSNHSDTDHSDTDHSDSNHSNTDHGNSKQ